MEFQEMGEGEVKQERSAAVEAEAGAADPEPHNLDQSAAVKGESPSGAAAVKAETDTAMDVEDEGVPAQAARQPSPTQPGGAAAAAQAPSPDVADGSRSSTGSEEALPDRRAAPAAAAHSALALEKVDVGGLSLYHQNDSASEPASAADPDPLELDEAGEPKAPEGDRKERTTRQRRTTARPPAQGAHSEDSEEDFSSSEEEEMRKTIMIGSAYQAVVPEGFTKYADKPYKHNDKLLWDPRGSLGSEAIDQYLQTSQAVAVADCGADGVGLGGLDLMPMGAHVRDDEQALFQLMQCNHNVEEALRKRQARGASPGPPNSSTPWTDEEVRNFENGILTFGKDFHTIQAQRVRTKTVSEIVQFYYLWKKTERHDIFANKMRPEKKKYMLHPGVTLVVYELLDKENQKDAAARDPVTA